MTDMFLINHPYEWIDRCFVTMAQTPQHIHQILTKRADRMCDYMSDFELRTGFRSGRFQPQLIASRLAYRRRRIRRQCAAVRPGLGAQRNHTVPVGGCSSVR
jgi:protein gp37